MPIDLRNLIPKDNQCYFIKNVVNQIDCSEANHPFIDSPGEATYPHEMLFRLVLMSIFYGGLYSREIERKQELTSVTYIWPNRATDLQNNLKIQT